MSITFVFESRIIPVRQWMLAKATLVMSTSYLRDSRVWKVSFRSEEKAFLDKFAKDSGRSLRELVDEAIQWVTTPWEPSKCSEFVLTAPGSQRYSLRVDSELFEQFSGLLSTTFDFSKGKHINSASLIATVIWAFVETHINETEASEFRAIANNQMRVRLETMNLPMAS